MIRETRPKRHPYDHADMPAKGLADLTAGGSVPQPHRPIFTSGGDHLPVRTKRHRPDDIGVTNEELAERLASGRVPQPHCPIPASGGDSL
jgi:hypothetical protein